MARVQKGWDTWSVFCLLIVERYCSFDTCSFVPSSCCSWQLCISVSSPPCHQVTPTCTAQLLRFPPSPVTPSLLSLPCSSAVTTQPAQPNKGQQQTKPLLEAGPHSQIIFVTYFSKDHLISCNLIQNRNLLEYRPWWQKISKLQNSESMYLGWMEESGSKARRLLPSCYSPAERGENGMDLQSSLSCKAGKLTKIQITQSLIQK